MSDWENVPTKVTNNNIKTFAGIDASGYAGGGDHEDPVANIKALDDELANAKHPMVRKALTEARTALQSKVDGWEVVPKDASPSGAGDHKSVTADAGWEDVPKTSTKTGPAVPFQSGQAFKDTKDLIPSMDDVKQWLNSPADLSMNNIVDNVYKAGNAALDTVAALPAMVAGGVHGIIDGVKQGDATAGLKTAGETMHTLLPSTLMEKLAPTGAAQSKVYNAAMAPVTAAMDTMNAVPTGFAEMLDKAGYSDAAAQLDAGGKLALMTVLGGKGVKEAYKAITGKNAISAQEAANKLEALRAQVDTAKNTAEVDQPGSSVGTTAHADDFAATNPYDVGGHVSEAMAGRESTIDNAQGDLFGSKTLEEAQQAPQMGQESIAHDTVPFTQESGLRLADEPYKHENSLDYTPPDTGLSLIPKEGESPNIRTNSFPQETGLGTRDIARAKAEQIARENVYRAEQETAVKSNKEAAFAEIDKIKQGDFSRMEAERQLQFAESINKIENGDSPARRAFLDRSNLDFQEAIKGGDKSLMDKGRTVEMRAYLRNGDVKAALQVMVDRHPDQMYRNLATYLMDKVEGLKIALHTDGVIRHGERSITGFYDPQEHSVTLSGLGATSPHTILHEITHAVTSHFINTNPKDMRVTGLKALFKAMVDEKGMKDFPGIVNVKEFVAEAFSNPRFQEFLKNQRMNNKTVWQRFVDGVRSIFGLDVRSPMLTAFEHAMDLGQQVVEAQTGVKDSLVKAGLPNALADLMAHKPEDIKTDVKVFNGESVLKGIPGLSSAISDFTFYDKPIGEIIEMAKNSPDIPNGALEKFAQQAQAGGLFESLKTRNPVVKQTFERISRAWQESSHNIKENLTDPETGLKKYMRDLNDNEKGEIHSIMMEHEGQRELSSMELAKAGFNEKQIAYYNKYRELSKQFFGDLNTRRAELGLAPMDARVGHMAGRFMGDFAQMIYKDGKVVGRIAGNTKWELQKASKYMMEQHPDYEFGPHEYNAIGKGRRPADRFGGLMEALNFLSKADGDVGKLMESYRNFLQKDALNFRNTMQHAKDKVKDAGGVVGSEGNKPWESAVKNAVEGMKAQLSYFEQGYEWMAMERAVSDLKPLLGDEGVIKQTPNAVDWAKRYVDHSMGRGQGKLSDAVNWFASFIGEATGIGHSNLLHGNAQLKHLVMQKFMGLGNIPFTVTQLMQPLAVQPAMIRLLRARGLEFSTSKAQLNATETYLHSLIEGHDSVKLSTFEKSAMQYADQMSIFDVKMADHTKDINANAFKEGYNKLADLNITAPEHLTRGMSFLFYAHLLKDAGIPAKDIFGAAENMTNFTMVNYHPMERPMGYAKLGWIGDVASTLTRYKHNQYSQLAFYGREAIRSDNGLKSSVPLGAFVGASLAFGGAMGFFAYNEADSAYQLFSEHVLKKPNSLTNLMLGNHLPEFLTHGLFSTIGIDMTTRFSNANLLPNSIGEAVMPYGSAIWDLAKSTGRLILDPTSTTKQKQFVKSIAPQSIQGVLENHMFTDKKADNKNLYINNTDGPNIGKGRVYRTDAEMTQRAFGFRSVQESKELAKNYSDSQIEKQHANIVDNLLEKVKYEAMDGSLTSTKLQNYATKAAQHGEDPSAFTGKYVAWGIDRQLSQSQQQLLRNAQKGFKGAFNIKQGR